MQSQLFTFDSLRGKLRTLQESIEDERICVTICVRLEPISTASCFARLASHSTIAVNAILAILPLTKLEMETQNLSIVNLRPSALAVGRSVHLRW